MSKGGTSLGEDNLEKITVHLHIHDDSAAVMAELVKLKGLVNVVITKENEIMAVTQEVRQLIADLNVATNDLADRVQALIDKVASGTPGISEVDAQGFIAELTGLKARLTGLGADTSNPIPDEPPV